MTITAKSMKRRIISRSIMRQLATESILALGRFRQTGQPPSHEDSPLLMDIWQRVRNRVLERGVNARIYRGDVGMALRITVSTVWDDQNRLKKFMAYDAGSGSLLLVGDMNGPVFSSSVVQATADKQPQTNTKTLS